MDEFKKAHLCAAVERSEDAIFSCDLEGTIKSWNEAASRTYGHRTDEIIGSNIAVLVTDEDQETVPALLDRVRNGRETQRFENLNRYRDGNCVAVHASISPITADSGELLGASIVAKAITEQDDRLTKTIESAPVAMVLSDEQGEIVLVNALTESLFGYSREELLGKHIELLIPERYRKAHLFMRGDFMDTQEPRHMGIGRKIWGLRKDGVELPLDVGLSPVHTRTGTFVLSAIADITKIREYEERFTATVDSAPIAMVMVDDEGKIVLVNVLTETLFGYRRSELLGKSVEVLIPDEIRNVHKSLRDDYLAAPRARQMGVGLNLMGQRKDGTRFPLDIALSPMHTSTGTFILAAIADISKLKEYEERFTATIESAPVAMVMIDEGAKIVLVNGQAEMLFQYKREELLSKPVEVLIPARFLPGHQALRDGFMQSPEARQMGNGRQIFGLRKDGSEVPLDVGLSPIKTHDGQFVLAAIADITERVRTVEMLKRHAEELRRSNEELEQFAYVASHDLQEPLRMVVSYMNLLEQRYQETMDEKIRKYVYYAVEGSQRMQRLVNDLLAYSRIGSQGKPLRPTSAERTLTWVLRSLEEAIKEAEATVTHGVLPDVNADEVQLSQAFQNLIGNALKFRGDRPPNIHIEAVQKGGMYVFSVADNGIGIETDQPDRVFQMFQRLHDRGTYEGSGIGLALTKKIVERHGGKIWFDTKIGEGTTFYFTMPPAGGQ